MIRDTKIETSCNIKSSIQGICKHCGYYFWVYFSVSKQKNRDMNEKANICHAQFQR